MNIEALKDKARKLQAAIDALKAIEPAAATLGILLEPLITKAECMEIRTPMEWRDIPGGYLFTEERLQQYSALERAYAQFQIELTGGETPILRRLKEQMGEIPTGSGTPD